MSQDSACVRTVAPRSGIEDVSLVLDSNSLFGRLGSLANKVLLISASPDYLINKLVRDLPFDAVFCSKMDAMKPWKYDFLCWGNNKVIAMDEWAKAHKFIPHVVRAYSDSKSDLPMMNIADEQIWINPKTGMPR